MFAGLDQLKRARKDAIAQAHLAIQDNNQAFQKQAAKLQLLLTHFQLAHHHQPQRNIIDPTKPIPFPETTHLDTKRSR